MQIQIQILMNKLFRVVPLQSNQIDLQRNKVASFIFTDLRLL